MKESTTKEKVLKRIRDALVKSMPPPYGGVDMETPVIDPPPADRLDEAFATAFTESKGMFVFCRNVEELTDGITTLVKGKAAGKLYCNEGFLKELLAGLSLPYEDENDKIASCQAALTGCESLVARHGSIVLSSRQGVSRKAFVMPDIHIVVAGTHQLVADTKDAYRQISEKYSGNLPSLITFVGGPSRTADIEKTLVYGMHGPREVYLFLLDMTTETQ